MMNSILTLSAFGLAFNDRTVLRSIDMDVPAKGITVILGPSGTGKSSLVRSLAGFSDNNPSLQTWGEVRYMDGSMSLGRPALVMQKAALMVSTVLENLLSNLPNRSSLTRLEQIEFLTVFCGSLKQSWVIDKLGWPVVKLDYHEQRAVSIIRETLARPALLMLDEPTESLADHEAGRICQLIGEVASMQPVLMILHNLVHARQLADHVVLIAGGVVQESSAANAFFNSPSSEAGEQFLRSGSCPECSLEPTPCGDEESVKDEEQAQALPSTAALPAKSRFMGPRGFVWLIPGRLAGTPWPGIVRDTEDDLAALRNVGVNRLVSLTEIPFDGELAEPFGIICANVPIPDMHAPSLAVAEAFCLDTDHWLDAGATIAIHCWAGLGRTGTLLAAYWLWFGKGQYSAIQAIEYVRRLESGMIQSQAQVDFLSAFADWLGSASDSSPHQTRKRPGEVSLHTTTPVGVNYEQA